MRRCVEHFAVLDSRCSAELELLPAVAEPELDFDAAERLLDPDVAEQAPNRGSTAEQELVADLGIAGVAADTVAEGLVHEVAVLER